MATARKLLTLKIWKQNNPEKVRLQRRKNYLKNREKFLERSRKRRLSNSEEISEYLKKYRINNLEKLEKYHSDWIRNNPERKLQYEMKQMKKYGFPLKLPAEQYRYALATWTKTVRKLHENLCQICNKTADVSHHLIYKITEPKLSLNINNGIPLCNDCHNEVHGRKLI